MTAGVNTAVEFVLLRKLDMAAESVITAATTRRSLLPAKRCSQRPTASITPVRTRVPDRIKIAHSTKITSLAKPANASAGVRIPSSTSATTRLMATTSIGSHSIEKTTMAPTRRNSRMPISNVTLIGRRPGSGH